jgi:hypothetical protein
LPQLPQFCVLVERSTHWLPHLVSPPLQPDALHAPAEHASPFGHLLPHEPQLLLSTLVLTQIPLHRVWPAGQPHEPCKQVWPLVQATPHAPQLASSDCRSTHALLQLVSPVPQDAAHAPLLQTGVEPEQLVPQEPQFCGSLVVSTHAPPHDVSPGAQTQLPPLHASVEPQDFPQPPQSCAFVCVSTHAPLQLVSAGSHDAPQAPRSHTCPLEHDAPHAPQLVGSDCRSAQTPLQVTWPMEQPVVSSVDPPQPAEGAIAMTTIEKTTTATERSDDTGAS